MFINKKNHGFGIAAIPTLASSIILAGLVSPLTYAQQNESSAAVETEEVLVKGVRRSLQNAQDLKRHADTFVDAISASDIGSLPDRSVLEAMQRIPGVSIERFQAANDPDHFGVEGSGAVIRGMTQTRSEFNGRDSFTANSQRGLSFQDVSPELMAGIDVYKNQTADMIEGGIGGTVSLRTRKPFDEQGRLLSMAADVTYGDIAEEVTPTVSLTWSDRWDTNAGEFGALLSFADSELRATSHGIQSDRYEFRQLAGQSVVAPGFEYVSNPYIHDGSFKDVPGGTEVGDEGVLVPNGSNLTMKEDLRERNGFAAAFQWQNPDDTVLATLQFLRSDATLSWIDNAIKYQTGFNNQRTYGNVSATPPEEYIFDSRGVFESGFLTDSAAGWRSNSASRIPNNFGGASSVSEFGHRFQTETRSKSTHTVIDDFAFNLKWSPTSNLEFNLDLQHVSAETEDDDFALMFLTHAVQYYQRPGDGSRPSLDVYNPWRFASEDAIAVADTANEDLGNGIDISSSNYFNEESSYTVHSAQDHIERSQGDSNAVVFDTTWSLDDSFITETKFGVRYAKREQNVHNSRYNWGALQPIWQNNGAWLDLELVGDAGLANEWEQVDWGNFYRGGVANIEGGNTVIHPSADFVRDYANAGSRLEPLYEDSCSDWRPLNRRVDQGSSTTVDGVCVDQLYSGLDGYFRPDEVFLTTEENKAAYVRVDFESDIANRRLAGNVGVRYVEITYSSEGSVTYPTMNPGVPAPANWNPNAYNPADYDLFANVNEGGEDVRFLGDINYYISPTLRNFANGASNVETASQSHGNVLPSLNLKYEISSDLLARFGLSKAIALPDLGNLRNYVNIGNSGGVNYEVFDNYYGPDNPYPDSPPDRVDTDGNGIPNDPDTGLDLTEQQRIDPATVVFSGWTATAGNPFLKPMESVQFDLSLEWYFSSVGSLTVSYFHKDLKNFFINGAFDREITNPLSEVTQTVRVAGPVNGGKGVMEGFEIAYQQFFDRLPSPWDGIGIQANYSYIQARGTPNDNLRPDNADGVLSDDSFAFSDELPLEGQSDETANFVLMYEKSRISARLAYNWRSEYLMTTRDVITTLPTYTDDAGYLDGSIYYNITDQFKIGLRAQNLTNTETRTFVQVDNDLKLGRSWFINDRRYVLELRATF